MYNNKEISSLSREELTKALQKFQLKCGPITNTTRRVFENRLRAYLEKCNTENESKEDKENWIVVDNKCYNGYNGVHNVKCEENGMGSKHTNNYDIHEKTYMSELTIIKTEAGNSADTQGEKLSNGKVEADDNKNFHTEAIINVDSNKDDNDSTFFTSKASSVFHELHNTDQSKVAKCKSGVVAHCVLDHADSGLTYNIDKYVNRIDQVNLEGNILANVHTQKVDFTCNALVLNELKTEIDFAHNAVLLNGIQSSDANEIDSETADGEKSSDIKATKTSDTISVSPPVEAVPDAIPTTENKSSCYYGIWIPYSSARINGNNAIVCDSQQEALQKMKGFKGSRFKVFELRADAEKFSLSKTIQSCEKVPPSPPPTSVPTTTTPESKEKILKCPTFQEVIKFRQHIEKFKSDEIEACLGNPRYLISPSDIPVILQEGSRMNAVHIATKCNRVKVLKMIFSSLQSKEFLQLAYSNASESHLEFRKNHLLDLYLNTPEKILCDTPLHMACKFGYTNIVKFLLTFKQLKINAQNTDRQTSIEVVCDRVYARSVADRDKIKSEILSLFEEKAYVPLYDNEDSLQSKIGQPILSISPNEIYSSKVKVKAYAGPMSPEQASNVFEKWKKSPRNRALSIIARSDFEKGMERIGRTIASDENVPFTEYWPFLDKYTNLATTQGLKKLEKYLKSKYTAAIQNCKKENCTSVTTTKKNSKNKHSRRCIESSNNENDKNPSDIKRKLTFDEAKPKVKNENKAVNDKNSVTKNKKKQANTDASLANQPPVLCAKNTLSDNQLKIVPSEKGPELNNVNSDKKNTILDERLLSHRVEVVSAATKRNNDTENETDNRSDSFCKIDTQNISKDVVCNIRNKLTNCAPHIVTSHSFCSNKNSIHNNYLEVRDLKKTEVTGIYGSKDSTVRCSPLLCLCDISISEECYLSETFSQLQINSEAAVDTSRRSHLSEDGNVDMDLVNQSVSFQSGKPLQNVDESNGDSSNETLCESMKLLEISSAERPASNSNSYIDKSKDSDSKLENMSQSSLDSDVPSSASTISPAPSLSVFDSPKVPTSSFNSPSPSLSSFENKMSIPGIINLPVKVDSGSDSNCFPEQHSVFIDGEQPSKQDLDVLRALGTTAEIDNFPHIRRWKCLIESYSDDVKSSWPSPGSPRYTKTLRRTLWTA